MSASISQVEDHWAEPAGQVKHAIVELTELVRLAADHLDNVEPHVARELRARARSLAIAAAGGLSQLGP